MLPSTKASLKAMGKDTLLYTMALIITVVLVGLLALTLYGITVLLTLIFGDLGAAAGVISILTLGVLSIIGYGTHEAWKDYKRKYAHLDREDEG